LLFFAASDASGYKEVADYYSSLGDAERPPRDLLALRPFVFPLYLGLYRIIGIAGMHLLQVMMNVASLSLLFLSVRALSRRVWLAAAATALLAMTPSFNFLAFHALTETFSLFVVCLFCALVVRFVLHRRPRALLWATIVLSVLLCTRPIVLPFWTLWMMGYVAYSFKTGIAALWRPVVGGIPVFVQLVLTFLLTGAPTLSPSGAVNISEWFFPAVYGQAEYGRRIHRKSDDALEGRRRFPSLHDKVDYLGQHAGTAIKVYASSLFREHLTAGTNFLQRHGEVAPSEKRAMLGLQLWSGYLNRFFACLHSAMAILLVGCWVSGARISPARQNAMWICYGFAAFLVLPAGLAYGQGDRYIVLAAPLWLLAHAAVLGVVLDQLVSQWSATGIRNAASS